MPHLTLEYSDNLTEPDDLVGVLAELQRQIAGSAGIDLANFKSRALRRDCTLVGTGEQGEGFVHLEIALFGGRPAEVKDAIGRASLDTLARSFAGHGTGPPVQITVEVREFDRANYFKCGGFEGRSRPSF